MANELRGSTALTRQSLGSRRVASTHRLLAGRWRESVLADRQPRFGRGHRGFLLRQPAQATQAQAAVEVIAQLAMQRSR